MQVLSATDVAIAVALGNNTLKVAARMSRFDTEYAVISDDHGPIEVHDDLTKAAERVEKVRAALVTPGSH